MIRHLRTGPHKALTTVEIRDLGKINVISGRNDSGKTTVLEAICDNGIRRVGVSAPPDYKVLDATAAIAGRDVDPNRVDRYKRIVHAALAERPAWYQQDADAFAPPLWRQLKSEQFMSGFINGPGALTYTFQALFPKEHRAQLIPARRRLETSLVYHDTHTPEPDGRNLIKQLLFLKNQSVGSADHQLHLTLLEAFRSITDGYAYDTNLDSAGRVSLTFSRNGAHWLPADVCGLGLQEILIIVYFALASRLTILAVEEPESHLHADVQRRLLAFLRAQDNLQVFLSTHSNVFLNSALVDKVLYTRCEGVTISVDDATTRAGMLSDLGYSVADNLVADVVVLVEGPTDVVVLKELGKKLGWPERLNVALWPMGGDIMAQLDLSVLTAAYQTIALIDKDPGSSRIRRLFQENCARHQVPVHQLFRMAIENYFSADALRSVFEHQIPATFTALDGSRTVEDQLGFSIKKQNRRLAEATALEEIMTTDLGEFLRQVETLAKRSLTR